MISLKLLRITKAAFALILCILLNLSSAHAVPLPKPEPRSVPAPPLGSSKVTSTRDQGEWDDIFVAHDQDVIVLRRGEELFSLAMEGSAKPTSIAKVPAVSDTQIFSGVAIDKSLWLFLNSSKAVPCAVDAYGGTVATFEIPGLKVPGSHAPGIQSSHIVPHLQAAIVMVSGGDRGTWPREGNRPIYFRIDLKSGRAARLPKGWDLDYFSADERVAVFSPTNAIDMRTGERTDAVPDRRKERCVPFDWTNRERVRPLYERRSGKGDADFFAGLSVGGRIAVVDLSSEERPCLALARADDSHGGFRLRRSGASPSEPSPLWIVPFKGEEKAESIAQNVVDFTMLGHGNTVYTSVEKVAKPGLRESRRNQDAFFYNRAERFSWDVLEGVERLPKLDEALIEASFVHDSLKVRLIEGFGTSRHVPVVLSLFEHHRGDHRALIPPMRQALESVTWRRGLLVDGNGQRSITPLFREDNLPELIWLHKSGKVISGTYVWEESTAGRTRQVQLSESTVQ